MWRRMFFILGCLIILPITVAFAEDAYLIGMSMTLTGPGADGQAPVKDALDVYFKDVNAKGGINGHPVKILFEDNSSEASKAAANAKKFVYQDKVILLMNSSLSSTYAPMIQVAKEAKVPLFFAGAACPPEVYPPNPDPFLFCSTSFGRRSDSSFALSFIKEQANEPIKIALVVTNIPLARLEIDYSEELCKTMQVQIVDKEVIPPQAADYTPYASKIKSSGANWVFSYGVAETMVKTFEALRKLGWKGKYLSGAMTKQEEIVRLKDGDLYVWQAQAYFAENTETHKKIKALAEKYKTIYPYTDLVEGWVVASLLQDILKKTSWPPTPEKVTEAMNRTETNLKDLRGGSLIWTHDNHYRTINYYKVYKWDSKKGGIVVVKDWAPVTVK